MENRSVLCLLIGIMPGQPCQRGQSVAPRHVVNRAANALRQAANALIRSRSYRGGPVSPLTNQVGCPEGHHGHGPSTHPTGLSHAEVRSTICRQGDRVLRAEIPQPTNPVAQKERNQTWIPDHRGPSLNSIAQRVSGERAKQPHSRLLPPDRNLIQAIHTPGQEQRLKELSHYNQNDAARQLWPFFPWCFYARCRERGSGSLAIAPMVAWRAWADLLPQKGTALAPVREIVSLSPPGRER